ncbi:MAG TPA: hypothetical protein VGF13_21105, partial [Verrucomicrobiae bacterium]
MFSVGIPFSSPGKDILFLIHHFSERKISDHRESMNFQPGKWRKFFNPPFSTAETPVHARNGDFQRGKTRKNRKPVQNLVSTTRPE